MTAFRIDEDLILRAFVISEAEKIFHVVRKNLQHLTFMWWIKPDYSLADAEEFIRRTLHSYETRDSLNLGLFRGDSFIGSVGFAGFNWDAGSGEIGYWIDKDEEGKGIVSRACRTLIDHGFNELKLNRIEIRCSADNVRSAAVPERFGFQKEGVIRQSQFRNGRLHDFAIYGLLASEWDAASRPEKL